MFFFQFPMKISDKFQFQIQILVLTFEHFSISSNHSSHSEIDCEKLVMMFHILGYSQFLVGAS